MHERGEEEIAGDLKALLASGRQVEPFSQRSGGFSLDEAYRVVEALRRLREENGETPVGRKIGFTNRSVWAGHGISGPIWNYMFDSTVRSLKSIDDGGFSIDGLPEPRIEPEIVLHLAAAPGPAMNEAEILDCIDWIAPGFEIVHSIFPNWRFSAADAAAAYGVHGALLLGEPCFVAADRDGWSAWLATLTVALVGSDGSRLEGHAGNVLGGPLKALTFLVEEIALRSADSPLKAGEIVTTGTLTEAMPARRGDRWRASFAGIELADIEIAFG